MQCGPACEESEWSLPLPLLCSDSAQPPVSLPSFPAEGCSELCQLWPSPLQLSSLSFPSKICHPPGSVH